MDPVSVHAAVESAFNDGDVDALVGLYEPDARMVRDDGTAAVGLDEIRAVWADLVAVGGRVRIVTRYAVESGDIALLSNEWTLELETPTKSDRAHPQATITRIGRCSTTSRVG